MLYNYEIEIKISIIFFFALNIGFAQKDCSCENFDKAFEYALYPYNDSLFLTTKNDSLRLNDELNCELLNLHVDFERFFRERDTVKMRSVLSNFKNGILKKKCASWIELLLNYNKAKYYRARSQFDSLGFYTYKVLSYGENQKNSLITLEALKQLVWLYTRLNEDEKRWQSVKRAELIVNELKQVPLIVSNFRWLAYQYENQFTITENRDFLDSTKVFINKAKSLASKANYTIELVRIYRALEAVSYHEDNLEEALVNIDSAIYYAKKVKGRINFSGLYLSKAWDHFDLKQYKSAKMFTDSMLHYDDKKDVVGYMMTLSQAAELYEGVGNTKKALSTIKEYGKIKDSVFSKERIQAINELENKYQLEKKEKAILKKDNEINFLYMLAIALVAIMIFTFLLIKQRQLKKEKKLNQQLKLSIKKREELEIAIKKAREDIAQDFHDEMGNKLARINLLSSLLQRDKSQSEKSKLKILQITEDAKELYIGTRDFIFSLKSNSDCLDELIVYLSDFGEDYFSKSDIRFILKRDIENNIKLPFYWSKQLVFIFKEAMTNTMKYAQSSEVCLSFKYREQELIISFKDNGVGLSREKLKSTNGLLNMSKRAKKIHGSLIIKSEKYEGTTITFRGKTTSISSVC